MWDDIAPNLSQAGSHDTIAQLVARVAALYFETGKMTRLHDCMTCIAEVRCTAAAFIASNEMQLRKRGARYML